LIGGFLLSLRAVQLNHWFLSWHVWMLCTDCTWNKQNTYVTFTTNFTYHER
jgi:hypothetical protein